MNGDSLTGNLVRLVAIDLDEDARLLSEWDRDSEFQRLLNSESASRYNPKQVREFFEKEIDSMHFYMIQRLEDNRKIGLIDLNGIDWVSRNAWVGIGIGEREFWGKGYGTDAMKVLLRYAFTILNLQRVTLNVFDFNQRGYASYKKSGFKEEGRLPGALLKAGKRCDLIFMGILRSEWEELQNQTQ
ncbi:GNAT family N-acetyltransferase [Bellilinea sp.]|uniref:GNAT family N-acetyltransferase n=1 Tax=Bellilinea sp. TaxID=2838785 RepID=UPI002ADE7D69|nr:GNAT family protein [Bellilinea sp.]